DVRRAIIDQGERLIHAGPLADHCQALALEGVPQGTTEELVVIDEPDPWARLVGVGVQRRCPAGVLAKFWQIVHMAHCRLAIWPREAWAVGPANFVPPRPFTNGAGTPKGPLPPGDN